MMFFVPCDSVFVIERGELRLSARALQKVYRNGIVTLRNARYFTV